jgi:hypothetical protein
MKRISLLYWGLAAICGALVMTATQFSPPSGPISAYDRGQLFGQAVAEASFLLVGFGIIAHFVKRRRNK